MTSIPLLKTLLTEAGQAHHHYEQTVLKGMYDQDWTTWYAQYSLDHGLINLLQTPLTVSTLSEFLKTSYQTYQTIPNPPPWADYTAQQLAVQFGV